MAQTPVDLITELIADMGRLARIRSLVVEVGAAFL
jgi:hypothetical protein